MINTAADKALYTTVAVPIKHWPDHYTYRIPPDMPTPSVGARVCVPFGKRQLIGIVLSVSKRTKIPSNSLKNISELLDSKPLITQRQLELCKFAADYYFAPISETLKLSFPPKYLSQDFLKPKPNSRKVVEPIIEITEHIDRALTREQISALQTINDSKLHNVFLLHGITGSGKTEVYIHAAKKIFEAGKTILFVVPEIGLTPQLEQRLINFFKKPIVTLHSKLKPKLREVRLLSLNEPVPKIILGTRSSLFAPYFNLGLIVVDEEHDASYKQDKTPHYNARDLAIWRARNEGAKIILGSATPSSESYLNAKQERFCYLSLPERVTETTSLPNVSIVDLKKQRADPLYSKNQDTILSQPLRDEIKRTLASNKQVLLFLNRRGFSTLSLCTACGISKECPNCSISLTYHKKKNANLCHHCGHLEAWTIKCAHCSYPSMVQMGLGTERIEEDALHFFPNAKILRLDSETVANREKLHASLELIKNGGVDIVVGTQMLSKGHDFPNLDLVGIILADTALNAPDFRAEEKAFQLLTQVAGRAGRGENMGRVIMQTFKPNHPIIGLAQSHDFEQFMKGELNSRRQFHYPPFTKCALIKIEGTHEAKARHCAHEVSEILNSMVRFLELDTHLQILGPSTAPIERLHRHFRHQIFIQSKSHAARRTLLSALRENKEVVRLIPKSLCRLVIDVDPINLL